MTTPTRRRSSSGWVVECHYCGQEDGPFRSVYDARRAGWCRQAHPDHALPAHPWWEPPPRRYITVCARCMPVWMRAVRERRPGDGCFYVPEGWLTRCPGCFGELATRDRGADEASHRWCRACGWDSEK